MYHDLTDMELKDLDMRNIKALKGSGAPLSTDLFSRLRSDILSGALQRGDKLTEQRICDSYKVSRTPVREAFKQLEMEGLIETIPNRGAFVIGLSPQDIADLYDLRLVYEELAVRWAIARITKRELEELEEAYEFIEFYTQKRDTEKMINININFHNLIYRCSHNRMLENTLTTYQFYMKRSGAYDVYVKDSMDQVLAEHRQIYQAFLDRDPDAGAAAIALHLRNAKQRARIAERENGSTT